MTKQEGVTEVWLSSEDTGAYGRDLPSPSPTLTPPKKPGLTLLLDSLLPTLPPNVMLRLGMTNPPFILDQLEAVAAALRHPNVFSFLHIPVQAGSDAVRGRFGVSCLGRGWRRKGAGHVLVCVYICMQVQTPRAETLNPTRNTNSNTHTITNTNATKYKHRCSPP